MRQKLLFGFSLLLLMGNGQVTTLEMTPALIEKLKQLPSANDQLILLYRKLGATLDRGDAILGKDKNTNGIRDDLDAFLDALQISNSERNLYRQNARILQQILASDLSKNTKENHRTAQLLRHDYTKFLACGRYFGFNPLSTMAVSETLESLTFNTKTRNQKYTEFNQRASSTVNVSLDGKEEYCE